MSYILDALKKSDEKRQALRLPQESSTPVQRSSSNVTAVIILSFVVVLAAMVGWFLAKSENSEGSFTEIPSMPAAELYEQQPADEVVMAVPPVTAKAILIEDEGAGFIPITPESTASGATGSIPERNELSPELLQAMPALKIEGHIYDENPAARMVIINGSVRRESQNIGNDLIVQEITPDGVILRYHGAIFHMGTFD